MKTLLLSLCCAIPLFARCQNTTPHLSPTDSLVAVRQVDSLVQLNRKMISDEKYLEALTPIKIAEQVAERSFGQESAAMGTCRHNHGRTYDFIGKLDSAEALYKEALAIRLKTRGNGHPEYAETLLNLASLYHEKKAYAKAEPMYSESIAIYSKDRDKNLEGYARSTYQLGFHYYSKGDYDRAEPLWLEASDSYAKLKGKFYQDYAWSLNDLTNIYLNKGDYAKAERLYQQVIEIFSKNPGKEHTYYAAGLNNLATLYRITGDYAKAEPLLLEAKEIRLKTRGNQHPEYAEILSNLGALYYEKGDFAKAELQFSEAKDILSKMRYDIADYAQSLSNLAILYSEIGDFEKAESMFVNANELFSTSEKKEHPDYAHNLKNLANVYRSKGDYVNAEPLLIEALTVVGKSEGKEHPDYADILNTLANLNLSKGDFAKAEPQYLEVKKILAKTLGNEHPDYAKSIYYLSNLYRAKGDNAKAELLCIELDTTLHTILQKACSYNSERELILFGTQFQKYRESILSFTQNRPTPLLCDAAYNYALFTNNALLDAAISREKSIAHSDSTTRAIHSEWKTCRFQLNNWYNKPKSKREATIVADLENRAELYEKELAKRSSAFVTSRQMPQWQDVQARLKSDEAAIEFIRYRYFKPQNTDTIMYVALLLRKGETHPLFIPLFVEGQLDSLLKPWSVRKADYANSLYSLSERSEIVETGTHKSLFELIWKPFEKHLLGINTVFFSPSGLLHRLNLGAIPVSDDQTLSDKFSLIQVKSTRQLVMPHESNSSKNDAVLFGGIRFESDSTSFQPTSSTQLASRGRGFNPEFGFASVDSILRANYPMYYPDDDNKANIGKLSKREMKKGKANRGSGWKFLPATEKEIKTVEKILSGAGFNTLVKKGSEATEEYYKNLGQNGKTSPRILHLATHGYFFPDPTKGQPSRLASTDAEPVFKMSDHPMLRSGLILAGGNAAWQGAKSLEGREDGVLTAYEISQMNLSNTELVVLSACETGLGDIQGNEGVYGLQRAFKIAGAKYLIMSLWQVDDEATSVFMTTFYRHWLADKMPIGDAIRTTQREMRERFIHPYQWAGFVLVE